MKFLSKIDFLFTFSLLEIIYSQNYICICLHIYIFHYNNSTFCRLIRDFFLAFYKRITYLFENFRSFLFYKYLFICLGIDTHLHADNHFFYFTILSFKIWNRTRAMKQSANDVNTRINRKKTLIDALIRVYHF